MEHRNLVLAYAFVIVLQLAYAGFTWQRWNAAKRRDSPPQ